jgi:hypothetical protein
MSKLPSKDNISIPAGEVFWQKDGDAFPVSLGHTSKFGWTPSVEFEPVEVSTTGVKTKVAELEKEVSVDISLTLQEMRADIIAMATAGEETVYTQASVTAETAALAGATAGALMKLGYLDVTNVSVEIDGVAATENTDYTVLAAAGRVIVRTPGDYVVTFDAPAITAGKSAIKLLQKTGLEGIFTVVQKNKQGKRYMLEDFRAVLRPSSELMLNSDGSAILNVELSGAGVYNEANPAAPWGTLTELS